MEKHLAIEALAENATCLTSTNSLALTIATTAVTAAVATVSVLALLRSTLYPASLRKSNFQSPLKTILPRLSDKERSELLYPPDSFPGARDVSTPYGSVRAYEWGPEDGPRVLMIHGISTSCLTLSHLAHGLVERGCRVLLFDLFGRGYTDGVGDLPHDARLYVTQAVMVMTSSPVSWTGHGVLRVVGYSLGAAIATHLAASFPDLVFSLVLLAPAGMIRPSNFGLSGRLFRSGLVPEGLLAIITRQRLRSPIAASRVKKAPVADVIDAAMTEVVDSEPKDCRDEGSEPLEKRVRAYVSWMLEHHAGFVPAFMSCVLHAPLIAQNDAYRALSSRPRHSTAILCARNDEIIDLREFQEDALPLVGGKDHIHWRVLPGAHDVPMTHPKEILAELSDIWGMK